MTLLESLLLGLVQGITEFLPVSSSGHLTLFGRMLQIDEAAMLSLTTLLHMGTLIAVFVVMRKEIIAILRDLLGPRTGHLIIATIPAVIAALLLGDYLDALFGGTWLGYSFMLTAIILLLSLMTDWKAKKRDKLTARDALTAGIGQAVAIMPGISRSGTTLTALLLAGVKRETAIRFSFLMSIPAILGGFVLDVKDMLTGSGSAVSSLGIGPILVGIAAAGFSGWFVMEAMLRKLTRRGMFICAVYVGVLGIFVLLDQNFLHLIQWN
ncbi:MAG: undecaprenyl-diphosphate phosphatase [Saccharofermentanales bacterium]